MGARRAELLADLKKELEAKYGVTVTVGKLDVGDIDSADKFFESLPAELRDNVDVLVNNAAAWSLPSNLIDVPLDDITNVVNTNVKGVVKMVKLFVPGMLKRNTGHIINVSSIVGKEVPTNHSIYAGSKHFLEAVNTSLRAELVATPLRVSLISPGMVHTDYVSAYFPEDSKNVEQQFFGGYDPLVAADIADGIAYIASRPPHVQVVDITIFPTAQSDVNTIHRKKAE